MLKAAVIGVGSMGRNHARVYRDLGGVSLAALADLQADAVRYGCRAYADYGELLRRERPDLVSVALPSQVPSWAR